MNPLLPGQAAVVRHEGKVSLVVCDHKENLPLGGVFQEVRSGLYTVRVEGVTVPVVNVVIRLRNYYAAWINELEEGVIESLATQPELPVILANPLGESVASAVAVNGLRELAAIQLTEICKLADKTRWEPKHFAAGRAYIEAQYPTADKLWEKLTA